MTAPVTGITPVFGIEYLVNGEPAKWTRQKLQRNAEKIEAALVQGPASPPGAVDLLAVSGRVSTLEGKLPGGWTAATLNATGGAVTNLGTTGGHTWQPARYRLLPMIGAAHVVGVLAATNIVAGKDLFTLPIGLRPTYAFPVTAQNGATGALQLDVYTTGVVQARGAGATFVAFDFLVPLG